MSQTTESRLKYGRRVRCEKNGPFNGKRGKVDDVMCGGEVAKVVFDDGSVLVDSVDYFETQ